MLDRCASLFEAKTTDDRTRLGILLDITAFVSEDTWRIGYVVYSDIEYHRHRGAVTVFGYSPKAVAVFGLVIETFAFRQSNRAVCIYRKKIA